MSHPPLLATTTGRTLPIAGRLPTLLGGGMDLRQARCLTASRTATFLVQGWGVDDAITSRIRSLGRRMSFGLQTDSAG